MEFDSILKETHVPPGKLTHVVRDHLFRVNARVIKNMSQNKVILSNKELAKADDFNDCIGFFAEDPKSIDDGIEFVHKTNKFVGLDAELLNSNCGERRIVTGGIYVDLNRKQHGVIVWLDATRNEFVMIGKYQKSIPFSRTYLSVSAIKLEVFNYKLRFRRFDPSEVY